MKTLTTASLLSFLSILLMPLELSAATSNPLLQLKEALFNPSALKVASPPIRTAEARFFVTKSWVEEEAGGGFGYKQELVCNSNFEVNVYDFGSNPPDYPIVWGSTCTTKMTAHDGSGRFDALISIGGLIYLKDTDLAGRSEKNKHFAPYVSVNVSNGSHWIMYDLTATPQTDLDQLWMVLEGQPIAFYKHEQLSLNVLFTD